MDEFGDETESLEKSVLLGRPFAFKSEQFAKPDLKEVALVEKVGDRFCVIVDWSPIETDIFTEFVCHFADKKLETTAANTAEDTLVHF